MPIWTRQLVVTVFMFGLGLGSLVGGHLSRRAPERLPILFLFCELAIGAFGLISLPLMQAVGSATLQAPAVFTGLVVFALLCIPTLLMGATLPILVAYLHSAYKDVGRTVGLLYFLNTLGSALACYLTADADGLDEIIVDGKVVNWKIKDEAPASVRITKSSNWLKRNRERKHGEQLLILLIRATHRMGIEFIDDFGILWPGLSPAG